MNRKSITPLTVTHTKYCNTTKKKNEKFNSVLASVATTKLAALAGQFGASFGRTPENKTRCARQPIR